MVGKTLVAHLAEQNVDLSASVQTTVHTIGSTCARSGVLGGDQGHARALAHREDLRTGHRPRKWTYDGGPSAPTRPDRPWPLCPSRRLDKQATKTIKIRFEASQSVISIGDMDIDQFPTLKEWLGTKPFSWQYWSYNEDYDTLKNHLRSWEAEQWYSQAEKSDLIHFHDARLNASFEAWAQPYWTVDQAAALTFGKDPARISVQLVDDITSPSIFIWYFKNLIRMITDDQERSKLANPLRPKLYLSWAAVNEISYPDALNEIVLRIGDDAAQDYLWQYRSILTENILLQQKIKDLKSQSRKPSTEMSEPLNIRSRDRVKEAIRALWNGDPRGVKEKERKRKINEFLRKNGYSEVAGSTISRAIRELRLRR